MLAFTRGIIHGEIIMILMPTGGITTIIIHTIGMEQDTDMHTIAIMAGGRLIGARLITDQMTGKHCVRRTREF